MTCPARYETAVGAWVVDEPADVRAVLLDPVSFPPDNALSAHTPIGARALRALSAVGFSLPPALANNATATHRPIRRLVAGFFSPGRVAATEPLVESLARARLATVQRVLDREGTADLVEHVASDLPAVVLLDLLGIAELEVPSLKRWSRDSLELFWGWPDGDRQHELAQSAAEFYAWLRERTATARRAPGASLFGGLASLGLSEEEICAVGYFLLIAGHETTSQLISTAYHRLVADQARWSACGSEPALATAAVEEVLRTESSVPTWRRTCAGAQSVGSMDLPAGSPLLLRLTGSGGDADLAFGAGVHRCLGAGLARMETRVAVQVASAVLPDIELCEPDPPMLDLLSFRAPTRVMVARREP